MLSDRERRKNMLANMKRKVAAMKFPFCDDVSKYEKIAKIGQGTFGEVFEARCKKTKEIVAMKHVLMDNEKEGFPITAIREIKILQTLKHNNIVKLIEVCSEQGNEFLGYRSKFFLIFEFCHHDLAGLLSNKAIKFELAEIKNVMSQLLNGLFFIHRMGVLHRDMKSANILITKDGILKLADFGLAKIYGPSKASNQSRHTNRVVTLWYRPPELILGERNYGPAIDLWGAGCIMAEMWTRSPIMQGGTEQHQINLISQLCGSITPKVWPDVEHLEYYKIIALPEGLTRKVRERLGPLVRDANALDLLDSLLTLDPKQRIDSDMALGHNFFYTEPMMKDLKPMLSKHGRSMFEYTMVSRQASNAKHLPQKTSQLAQQTYVERIF